MSAESQELYSLLIPLAEERLIVPRACVAEVVRHALSPSVPGEPSWLRGRVPWLDRELPVICFEELAGLPFGTPGGRTRVTLFHALASVLPNGAFGILSEGFPQLVRVNRQVMEPDTRHPWPEDGPVICQIRMINEYPLIPDLERLELMIAGHMTAGVEPA